LDRRVRRIWGLVSVLGVLFLAPGCGGSEGCLTRSQVEQEVNEIANGFENSTEEVEAKQEEIREVRARECR